MKERIRSNKTVVLVSHSVPLLKEVCDRVLWIEDGMTREQGNVAKVVDGYMKYLGIKN